MMEDLAKAGARIPELAIFTVLVLQILGLFIWVILRLAKSQERMNERQAMAHERAAKEFAMAQVDAAKEHRAIITALHDLLREQSRECHTVQTDSHRVIESNTSAIRELLNGMRSS